MDDEIPNIKINFLFYIFKTLNIIFHTEVIFAQVNTFTFRNSSTAIVNCSKLLGMCSITRNKILRKLQKLKIFVVRLLFLLVIFHLRIISIRKKLELQDY